MLIILQGVSGSGKSTLAKELAIKHDAVVYSTDEFFVQKDGTYKFDGSKLSLYHRFNQDRARTALKEGKNVIIDNTNLQKWTCKEYCKAAVEFNHDVQFIRVSGNFQNVHGVPADKVESMKRQMEELTLEGCLASKSPYEK